MIKKYGDGGTIHNTEYLNIEVDEKTGEVVSVWFRCMALPFKISQAGAERADEMRQMYEKGPLPKLVYIEYETEDEK
jgi:hypothetical protein